jgi:hypothetical protein
MKSTLRTFAACAVVLALAGSATAQNSFYAGGPLDPSLTAPPSAGYAQVGGDAPAAPTAPVLAVSPLATPQPAEQLGQTGGDGPWVVVAPYAWIFGMQGSVVVRGRYQQVDLSVQDAIDHIDDIEGAAALHVEAGYGNVGVIADLLYLKLVPLDRLVRVESESTLFELLGMYRVWGSSSRAAGSVYLDVLAGARYYRFSNSIEGNILGLLSVERTNSWIDLVVGARVGVQVLDCLGLFARGDAGGFGIGTSSNTACNVIVGFEYQCCECASLAAGYRWFRIDRTSGVGADANGMEVILAGPFVAFGLRF